MQQSMRPETKEFIENHFYGAVEVSAKEVAYSFGVTTRTIYNYIQSGKIPAVRRFGYKIAVNDLAAWLDKTDDF